MNDIYAKNALRLMQILISSVLYLVFTTYLVYYYPKSANAPIIVPYKGYHEYTGRSLANSTVTLAENIANTNNKSY